MKDETFSFAHPWLLLLLLLLPLLAWLQGGKGPAPAVRFSTLAPLRAIASSRRAGLGGLGWPLLLLALGCFIVALARPRLGRQLDQIEASGVDIILSLDVSGSMYARDFTIGGQKASRLDAVKDVTQRFIEARPNDRIGIVCFAGQPYMVSPLTLDHDWLFKNLERVRIGLVEDGTAIGSAIASSANRLKNNPAKSKVIVLLTDGDETVTTVAPNTAAEAAKKLGIKIYTIAAGSKGMAEMPVGRDFMGNLVYGMRQVQVEEEALKKIAEIGGGKFYRATDTASLKQIFEDIDQLEKTEIKLQHYTEWRELFPWCMAAGLALAGLQVALGNTLWRTLP